jgi:RNA recognition motif-containing protein
VQYEKEEEANAATQNLHNYELNGKKIEVIIHEKRDKRENATQKYNNLYVKNFLPGTNEQSLRDMFSPYGEIDSIHIPVDENKAPKDHGYVCFKKPEDAEKAQEALNKLRLGEDRFLIVN